MIEGVCFVCPSLYFLLRTPVWKKCTPGGPFPTIILYLWAGLQYWQYKSVVLWYLCVHISSESSIVFVSRAHSTDTTIVCCYVCTYILYASETLSCRQVLESPCMVLLSRTWWYDTYPPPPMNVSSSNRLAWSCYRGHGGMLNMYMMLRLFYFYCYMYVEWSWYRAHGGMFQ